MSGGSDTTTQSNFPEWAIPYAQSFLGRSQQVADTPYQAYDGQRVAQQNPYQLGAYNAIASRAANGSPVSSAANGEITKTLNGGYLNNNPYMQSMVDQSSQDVLRNYNQAIKPATETAMVRSGSFGNSGLQQLQGSQQGELQRNLGNISTTLRGNDYANERGRMQNAVGMSTQIANQDYTDANQLLQAGRGIQGQEQANLDDQYGRFTEARDYQKDQLATLGKGIGLNYGSSTTGPGSNPWAQGLGAGLAAYGAYNGSTSSGGGK